MEFVEGDPIVTGLSGGIGAGTVRVNSRIDMGRRDGPQRACVSIQRVDAGEVIGFSRIHCREKLACRASGVMDLHWEGMKLDEARKSVRGTFDLTFGPGRLSDSPTLSQVARTLGINGFEEVEFTRGRIRGTVADGRLVVSHGELKGQLFHIRATGTVGLADGKMDVALTGRVREELAKRSSLYRLQNVVSFLGIVQPIEVKDEFVAMPDLKITGDLIRPDVAIMPTQAQLGFSATKPGPSFAALTAFGPQ